MNNNTTLVLEGTNNVTGFYESYPGIYIASGKTLIIQGDGTLNASSNDVDVEDYYGGAGIGLANPMARLTFIQFQCRNNWQQIKNFIHKAAFII